MKCPNCGSVNSGYGDWWVGGCKACGIAGGTKKHDVSCVKDDQEKEQ